MSKIVKNISANEYIRLCSHMSNEEMLIGFAKYHVVQAHIASKNSVNLSKEATKRIEESYPLSNIK